MSLDLTRRELLALGLAAPAAHFASILTGDGGRSAPARTTRVQRDAAAPQVVATYRAAPVDVDLGGMVVSTWAYDGVVPGKLLRARVGDLVEVTVNNGLDEPTSIHWHGIAIDNAMDGVPGLTQPELDPGSSYTYRFVVPDAGTYWFHPHHGLQLDRGLYAPLIVDADNDPAVDAEYVIVLDDWLDGTGTTPDAELVRIREMGAAMGSGGHDMVEMATSAVLGGDAGDAVYPHHLINGRPLEDPLTLDPQPSAGDRIRLRFINAGGDTAYRVALAGHRLIVSHNDGFPIEPVEVDTFLIGMGERYDVTVDVQSGVWPLIALAEGKNNRAAAILRTRDAAASTSPDVHATLPEHDRAWLRYTDQRATADVALRPTGDVRTQRVELTGDMTAFDWGIDGLRYGDHAVIGVDEGEWFTLQFDNTSTMWHPIHLHGHTGQLDPARGGPRKDTINVLPGQTAELLIHATNPGQWMVHCHNAYHLEAGMATVLTYR